MNHNARALQPGPGECLGSSLEELSRLAPGPDDVPLEVDDLAAHFLLEATQAAPSSPPAPEAPEPQWDAPLEASLGEACFEGVDERAGQRAFERLWREIISRELTSGP